MNHSQSKCKPYLQRDKAKLLYRNAAVGIMFSMITASCLVLAFNSPVTTSFKKMWWGGMITLLVLRMMDVVNWKTKLQHTAFDGDKAINRFMSGVNPTAIMWSIYLLYITTHAENIELTTTIIAISAIAIGSSIALSAHKYMAVLYVFPILSTGSIALTLSEEYALKLLGVLGLVFNIMMLITSRKSVNLSALFLNDKNADLIHIVEDKVEQHTQQSHALSHLDPLTLLINRSAFLSHVESVIAISKKPFALLFVNLDGFKQINNAIGHQAGDQILRETAERLKKSPLDTQALCRWGCDEFLMVITDIDEISAVKKSKQVISIISEPHNIEHNVLSVGATIGISLYPKHAITAERLIHSADMAMCNQKKQARSTVGVFSEKMEQYFSHELHLKNKLIKAIDKQQLRLVFQPLLLSKNKKVVAFEALLRWQLDDENIPPAEFIVIAEKYGLIVEIGAWVLKNACLQASQWNSKKKLAVCVNVSVVQLHDEHFIDIIDHALSNSSLPPELLHIEITESVFSADTNIIANQIKRLQTRGIKVAIDDFGTGYSSLSAIQDLAVDVVKIDRSFVDKVDGNGYSIISAVMHITSALDFLVVAEGVENEVQAEALSKLGVHYLQGYHYARPMEIEDIARYLSKNHH